jgi:RND family efflux transporter MFP subunit
LGDELMKKNKLNNMLVILTVIFTVIIIVFIRKIAIKPLELNETYNKIVPIEFYFVKRMDVKNTLKYNGILECFDKVDVIAKRSGIIRNINFEEGDYIESNDILVTLDEEDLFFKHEKLKQKSIINENDIEKIMLQINLLKEKEKLNSINLYEIENLLKSIIYEMNSSYIKLENLKKEYDRNKILYEKNAVSKSQFEKIESDYLSLKEKFEQLKVEKENIFLKKEKNLIEKEEIQINKNILNETLTQTKRAYDIIKIEIEELNLQLDYSKIGSNYSGVVLEKYKTNNDIVNFGSRLATIGINKKMKVIINIPLKTAVKFDENTKAILTFDFTDKKYLAEFYRLNSQVDLQSGLIRAEFIIDNDENLFKNGMPVNIDVLREFSEGSLAIPVKSIANRNNKTCVFVIKNDEVILKEVKTGIQDGKYIEILSGLNIADKIAITNIAELEVNDKVYLVKEGE